MVLAAPAAGVAPEGGAGKAEHQVREQQQQQEQQEEEQEQVRQPQPPVRKKAAWPVAWGYIQRFFCCGLCVAFYCAITLSSGGGAQWQL